MWSEELKMVTKEFMSLSPTGCVKHFGDLRFGTYALVDSQYIITENTTNAEYKFDSIEALIEAGWAID